MKNIYTTLFVLLSFLYLEDGYAQVKNHMVYFKDKAGSPYSLASPNAYLSARAQERRTRYQIPIKVSDLPPNPSYVQQVAQAGGRVRYLSKWMNAVLVEADASVIQNLSSLPFVKSVTTLNAAPPKEGEGDQTQSIVLQDEKVMHPPFENCRESDILETVEDYGNAKTQNEMLGIHHMHEQGFRGEDMHVAIIDGGFQKVNELSAFNHLTIADTWDFVQGNEGVYEDSDHGTKVLSTMAAYVPGQMIGGAYNATYYLYKSEDVRNEMPVEEAYWLFAAERADSAGVDVINTSLGYYDFDNSTYNYSQSQLDGNTALITKATDLAAATGMLLVTSAGNEGNNTWKSITFPADADSVFTIGAIDVNYFGAGFSGLGPTADGRIKPDVVGVGQGTVVWSTADRATTGNGTSFSGPLVCGLVTGFWQANRDLNNIQIMEVLRNSASLASNPNNKLGYGVPSFDRAMTYRLTSVQEMHIAKGIDAFPNPLCNGNSLNLRFSEEWIGTTMNLEVQDILGRTIHSQSLSIFSSTLQCSPTLSSYKGQILVLKLTGENVRWTQRILVQ